MLLEQVLGEVAILARTSRSPGCRGDAGCVSITEGQFTNGQLVGRAGNVAQFNSPDPSGKGSQMKGLSSWQLTLGLGGVQRQRGEVVDTVGLFQQDRVGQQNHQVCKEIL